MGFLLALAAGANAANEPPRRAFESRDAIEIAEFTEPPIFSPDGRHFVTATQRGVFPEGVTEATVWLFDTAEVRARLRRKSAIGPVPLARIRASINEGSGVLGQKGVLMRLEWLPDSEAVVFMGRDQRDNRQLFRAGIADNTLVALTPPSQDVVDYRIGRDRIVYFAGPDASADKNWWSVDPSAPDIVVGTGEPLMHLLYPNYERSHRAMPTPFELWQIRGTRAEPILDASGAAMRVLGSYNVSAMTLAEDGTRMIAVTHADDVPLRWEEYTVLDSVMTRGFRADPPRSETTEARDDRERDYSRALQYMYIDLANGRRRALFDAPVADPQRNGVDTLQAQWSPDMRHIAVAGTFLPLDAAHGGQTKSCSVAVVDTQTDGVACLSDPDEPPLRVRELRWLSDSRVAAVTAGSGPHIFERDGSQWKRSSDKLALPVAPRALEVSIQQALDLPPAVFAKDVASGKEARIFDPNPQLAGIDLGSVEPYSWKDRHGRVIRAGLVKPPKLVPGRRYPLVIQTHGFRGDRFFRVGFSDTSNAGRALAGRGIVVLQVAEPFEPYEGTSEEGEENGTQVYLSAIDKLSAEGLIDPTKVGITGYSRMGFFAAKAITDAPDRFAAAVIANADPGSLVGYFSYIDYIMPTYARNAAELFAGELPYAEGMEQWLKKTPGFRTELIRAPVLISAADPQHLISLWGLYAPLRDQRKPVELQYIRSGSHNISKPLQKLAHQDLIVDWFDFWLNGHEDPSEHKAAQYRRWKAWAGSDKGN